MKRSNRILLVLAVIEFGLAGLWLWLVGSLKSGELQASVDPAEAVATISSTLGGAMGVFAGVCLAIWWVLRRKGE